MDYVQLIYLILKVTHYDINLKNLLLLKLYILMFLFIYFNFNYYSCQYFSYNFINLVIISHSFNS